MPDGRLIFGGSFNPLHIGHMRVAIEALRLLRSRAGTLEFMPSASPPHKPCVPMLPFDLRVRLIDAAIGAIPEMVCDAMEGDRAGYSYTWDSLHLLGKRYGAENLYFLIGSQDFRMLPEWHRGLELSGICHLVVVPRGDYSKETFVEDASQFWHGEISSEQADTCLHERIYSYAIQEGLALFFLPVPYLEISATYIRALWLCKGDLDYLVPGRVRDILDQEKQTVDACWREKKC